MGRGEGDGDGSQQSGGSPGAGRSTRCAHAASPWIQCTFDEFGRCGSVTFTQMAAVTFTRYGQGGQGGEALAEHQQGVELIKASALVHCGYAEMRAAAEVSARRVEAVGEKQLVHLGSCVIF
eukprot:474193-Pleurochrysis_carterae.AAC.1